MQMRRAIPVAGAIYLAVLAYIALRWDAIPNPVPMHIGPGGEVDQWSEKTVLSVTAVTWIGVIITAAIALCAPSESLATARREPNLQNGGDALPYSESASTRAQQLIGLTGAFLGGLLVATSVLLALTQVMLVFPGTVPPTLWWVVFGLYMGYGVVASVSLARKARQSWDGFTADADEMIRVEQLKRIASMGIYTEERDQMAVAVLPDEPGKLQINAAHPAGRRLLRRIGLSIGGSIVLVIVLAVVAL